MSTLNGSFGNASSPGAGPDQEEDNPEDMAIVAHMQALQRRASIKRGLFYASTLSVVLSGAAAFYIARNLEEGGTLDIHARADQSMKAVMALNPDMTESQARSHLNDRATATEGIMFRLGVMNLILSGLCSTMLCWRAQDATKDAHDYYNNTLRKRWLDLPGPGGPE